MFKFQICFATFEFISLKKVDRLLRFSVPNHIYFTVKVGLGYTVSIFRTFFVRTENASAFFYASICKQYTLISFFVVRTKAHPQILRTHRVEHGSTFVRFRTYHRVGYLS